MQWFCNQCLYVRPLYKLHADNISICKNIWTIFYAQRQKEENLPSIIDIWTALLHARGTLLCRGPWAMEGQLLLGTIPALRKTNRVLICHLCANESQFLGDDYRTGLDMSQEQQRTQNKLHEALNMYPPVDFWWLSSDFGTLLHHLLSHLPTVRE